MAATVRVSIFTGAAEGAGATAETGIKFNKDDTLAGTTAPIPIPTATGTAFSWHKNLALEVTATDTTAISNRKIHHAAGIATGVVGYFLGNATYLQAAAADTDTGSNGSVPSGYTALTTSAQTYHSGSVSAGSTGRNGNFARVAVGVSNNYAGGAGSANAFPTLTFTYDEA